MRRAILLALALVAGCASTQPAWCGSSWRPIYHRGLRCATGRPVQTSEPVYYVDDCNACAGYGPWMGH